MSKILQLGYGMQGKGCVYDLLKHGKFSQLTIVDCYDNFHNDCIDLADDRIVSVHARGDDITKITELMKAHDVVIELFPPQFTLDMAELAVKLGVNLLTTSYVNNPSFANDVEKQKRVTKIKEQAVKNNVIILEEFGMDPGIDLAMGKMAISQLDEVHSMHSYGAGFPDLDVANNPLKYKFTWSIIGVIKSYLRPATILKDGKVKTINKDEIFSKANRHNLQIAEFDEELECFCNGNAVSYISRFGLGDSLKEMGRYICRWAGHGDFWEKMAKCGFLGDKEIDVNGVMVKPDEFCASLLASQDQFFYKKNESDAVIVRVEVKGIKNGEKKHFILQMLDTFNHEQNLSAMQRTVSFSASIGCTMILENKINTPGLLCPIDINIEEYFKQLERRSLTYDIYEKNWDGKL